MEGTKRSLPVKPESNLCLSIHVVITCQLLFEFSLWVSNFACFLFNKDLFLWVFNFTIYFTITKNVKFKTLKLSTNKVCFYCLVYFSDYDCETVCRILAVLGSNAPLLPSDAVSTLIGGFIIS